MALNSWHVNLPPELKEPVWTLARSLGLGPTAMLAMLVRFGLTRPEALRYYFVMDKNSVQQATIVQNALLMDLMETKP